MRLLLFGFVTVLLTTASAALAQANPFDGLNSRGRSYADPARYAQAKNTWLARVEAMPENVDVLEGAADFFNILDRPLALELLQRASALEPNNPKWVQKLAQVHRLNASSGDVAEAQTALSLMERAYTMSPAANQGTLLTNLPSMAFDAGDIRKARAYAERLLVESKSDRGGWNYGNAVPKVQKVHRVPKVGVQGSEPTELKPLEPTEPSEPPEP